MRKWFNNSDEGGSDDDGFSRYDIEDASPSGTGGKPKKKMRINKKKPWSLKKKIIVSCASVLIAAILGVVIYFLPSLLDPMGGMVSVGDITPAPGTTPTSTPYVSDGVLVTPTPDPMEELKKQANFDKLKDIVNILLIGVDHGDERDAKSWRGKTDFHSDVMIVMAIDTKTNAVSLISLPRDTYSYIPDMENSVYRLNASLNCGGGWPEKAGDDTDAPFRKVCEAVSWNIGGIPIDYYYAVDFTAVKQLVDAIGGVNYNLDITFKMNGRKYTKGQQHMNGQAVLDYLRVRKDKDIISPKSGQDGDLARIKRQKNMLKQIFVDMKSSGLIFKLGDILGAFEGKLFTNVDIRDTLGFAIFAYNNINPDNVKIYSIEGSRHTLFDLQKSDGDEMDALGLFFPNKASRAEKIKEVYGVNIKGTSIYKDYDDFSYSSAAILWARMQNYVIVDKSRSLLDQMKVILDEDAKLDPAPTPESSPDTSPDVSPDTSPEVSLSSLNMEEPPGGYRKYGDDVHALFAKAETEYEQLAGWGKPSSSSDASKLDKVMTQFKKDFQSLIKTLAIKIPKFKSWDDFWAVVFNTPNPKEFNQPYIHNKVFVDMR